jgi:hypothetical protein
LHQDNSIRQFDPLTMAATTMPVTTMAAKTLAATTTQDLLENIDEISAKYLIEEWTAPRSRYMPTDWKQQQDGFQQTLP